MAVVPRKKPIILDDQPCEGVGEDEALGFTGTSLGSGKAAAVISASVAPSVSSSWWIEAGRDDGLLLEVGGGGNGDALASPIRKRVRVNWALVGIPLSSELYI